MKCRELKVWYDEDKKKNNNLVWFGSYGKDVLAKEYTINVTNLTNLATYPLYGYSTYTRLKEHTAFGDIYEEVTEIKYYTTKGQTYYLDFTVKDLGVDEETGKLKTTKIRFVGSSFEESFEAESGKTYHLKGILPQPLTNVFGNGEDFEEGKIVFKEYGKAKKNLKTINGKESAASFVDEKEGIISSLTERLSVLQGELWYKASYGQPITSITKSKILMDSFIVKVIESHPDVKSIDYFESYIENKKYYCYTTINTTYGNIELNL